MNPGTDWLDTARRLVDVVTGTLASAAPTDGATGAGHGADCRWCPVCQAAAVLRGERPEVTAALADALTSAAAALRAFADAGRTDEEASATDGEPAASDPPADPPPSVQRIEIA
jgi:hypothetical protein